MSQRKLIYIIEDDRIMAECIARAVTTAIPDRPRRNESGPLPVRLASTPFANASASPSAKPITSSANAPDSLPGEVVGDFSVNVAAPCLTITATYRSNDALNDQPDTLSAKLPTSGQGASSPPEDLTKNDQQSVYTKRQHNVPTEKLPETDQQSFFNEISETTSVKNHQETDQRSFYNKNPHTAPKEHFDKTDQQSFSSNDIRIFNDAISAMDAISGELPDLILLDVLLSGPNGFTLLNELASYADTSDIPIVIISSLELRQRDLEPYGVIKILNKSTMTPQTIREAIRHAL